jgi:hypothetical protein
MQLFTVRFQLGSEEGERLNLIRDGEESQSARLVRKGIVLNSISGWRARPSGTGNCRPTESCDMRVEGVTVCDDACRDVMHQMRSEHYLHEATIDRIDAPLYMRLASGQNAPRSPNWASLTTERGELISDISGNQKSPQS